MNQSMSEQLATLTQYPIRTRLSLSGTLVVARDIAHAKLKERIDRGEGLPQYMKDHPVYYAGPAKTPEVSTLSNTEMPLFLLLQDFLLFCWNFCIEL